MRVADAVRYHSHRLPAPATDDATRMVRRRCMIELQTCSCHHLANGDREALAPALRTALALEAVQPTKTCTGNAANSKKEIRNL